MYVARNIKWSVILVFAWMPLVFFLLYSLAVVLAYSWLGWKFIAVPFLPIGVIGTAVAFYVGFKNNSSYERLWEARRIWGNIVNYSRTFGLYVTSYVRPSEELNEEELPEHRRELIYRHLAYVNAVRIQLRTQSVWDCNYQTAIRVVDKLTRFDHRTMEDTLKGFLSGSEWNEIRGRANLATQIMKNQGDHIAQLVEDGCIDDFRHIELGKLMGMLYDQQGACERIKTFPFPRQYAYFSKLFVWIFILLLPLGMVGEFAKLGELGIWLCIPFYTLIAWIFNTMEVVGDTSENPFENGINDVPMTAICRTIEIDLREMLNEAEVPERITPANNILM